MMNRITFVVLFSLLITSVSGQSISDTIEIRKAMGVVFLQQGKPLKPAKLLDKLQSNPEAYQVMKTAKANYDMGSVIGFIGGFMLGWPLGTAMAGGDPNWAMAGIGAALIGVSIPFSIGYSKNAKIAVHKYNDALLKKP